VEQFIHGHRIMVYSLQALRLSINEFSEYIHSEDTQITEYNEKLVRKYIDQIKVYDDRFVICFKAKVEIVIKR